MLNPYKEQGFTFIELLVALLINSFLLMALISIFLVSTQHAREMININRLNSQLQNALFIMSNEIRRAGYSAGANTDIGLDQNTNPFMASGVNISVNAGQNCILFAYDHDNNGTLPSISSSGDDERYGFRLMNQAIQVRPPGASFSCTSAASDWENMTDTSIMQITALTFTLTTTQKTTGPATRAIAARSVDISITGQLTSTPGVTKTLTQHIRIRNDQFIP